MITEEFLILSRSSKLQQALKLGTLQINHNRLTFIIPKKLFLDQGVPDDIIH
jgi:hypothetical protein